jgi:hypothetical protein
VIQQFVSYVRERQAIFDRRQAGEPVPWSTDPILQKHKFCCVIRDDDRTSREAKRIILGLPEQYRLSAALGFRIYNRVESLEALAAAGWPETRDEVLKALPEPAINSLAYKISVKGGLFYLPGIADVIVRANKAARRNDFQRRERAELTCQSIRGWLGVGAFVAYQTAQDLRWLYGPYEDEQERCMLGLGAIRGISRLQEKYVKSDHWSDRTGSEWRNKIYGALGFQPTKEDMRLAPKARDALREIQQASGLPNLLETEHNLCEWDKYERIRTGEGTGRRWRPTA